jgi:hypothetical protein
MRDDVCGIRVVAENSVMPLALNYCVNSAVLDAAGYTCTGWEMQETWSVYDTSSPRTPAGKLDSRPQQRVDLGHRQSWPSEVQICASSYAASMHCKGKIVSAMTDFLPLSLGTKTRSAAITFESCGMVAGLSSIAPLNRRIQTGGQGERHPGS